MYRLLIAIVVLAGFVQGIALAQTEPFVIPVILSVTGPAAATGATELQALQIYEKVVNRTGGIRGRNVHFDIHDDSNNPQTALQLTNAIMQTHPAVILGSMFTQTCAAMAPLMKTGPVNYCLSPGVATETGGYVFASSTTYQANTLSDLSFARDKGFKRIGVMASTDASGQESQHLVLADIALPAYKSMKLVDLENFAPTDISMAAQIAKIKAANPDFLYVFASGTPLGTILRGLHDADVNVPVLTTATNMNIAQLSGYDAFLPKELLFLGAPYQAGNIKNPGVRDATAEFIDAYSREGMTNPSSMALYAWEPARVIVHAYRALGTTATAEQLRNYLEGLHDFAGLYGVYDFRTGDQHGVGSVTLPVVRWDAQKRGYAEPL